MANNNLNNNNELFLLSAEWLIWRHWRYIDLLFWEATPTQQRNHARATSGLRCLLSEFGWECFSPRQSLQFAIISTTSPSLR